MSKCYITLHTAGGFGRNNRRGGLSRGCRGYDWILSDVGKDAVSVCDHARGVEKDRAIYVLETKWKEAGFV